MPKPRRRVGATSDVRATEPPRNALPLPAERIADVAFVWDGHNRIICPWPRHALWPERPSQTWVWYGSG